MTSLDKFLPIIGVLVLLACLPGYTFGRRRKQADENTGEAVVRRLLSTVFAGNDYHLMNNMVFLWRNRIVISEAKISRHSTLNHILKH